MNKSSKCSLVSTNEFIFIGELWCSVFFSFAGLHQLWSSSKIVPISCEASVVVSSYSSSSSSSVVVSDSYNISYVSSCFCDDKEEMCLWKNGRTAMKRRKLVSHPYVWFLNNNIGSQHHNNFHRQLWSINLNNLSRANSGRNTNNNKLGICNKLKYGLPRGPLPHVDLA